MRKIILLFIIELFFIENLFCISPDKQKQLDWFKDAKFGMFIHWGVYSMIGRHEWVRHYLQIPLQDYQYYVDNFNPIDYDPDKWVDIAKEAGMKYIVITSKHHDGFCIFDSKSTDYDVMHSRYGKDALRMLVDACKRKSMVLGFYYSIMDWHHPDYIPRRKWEVNRPIENANLDRYIMQYMKGQLEELIKKYNPAILWFDGEWEHSIKEMHSAEIEEFLLKLKPDLLINDRLFKREPGYGDFGTPENYVPATGIKNPDGSSNVWESCYTMGYNSWGYNPYEIEFHSTAELIRMLVEIVSKGGNLLLNVGPTPNGIIPIEFVDRLKGIGKWMKVNGEAIYGTTPNCFEKLPFFGRCTVKENKLYFHIMGWPSDGILRIPGLKTNIKRANLLIEPQKQLNFKREDNDVIIELPKKAPDEIATVVAVELSGNPVVEQYKIKPDKNGVISLPVYMAEIQSRLGQRAFLDHCYNHTLLVNWRNTQDIPVWNFSTDSYTDYDVSLFYAGGSQGSEFKIIVDDKEINGVVKSAVSPYFPQNFSIGKISLQTGEHTLKVQILNIKSNEAMKLEKVILTRQK